MLDHGAAPFEQRAQLLGPARGGHADGEPGEGPVRVAGLPPVARRLLFR